MDLTSFKVLSFDCYGTLIDWETGIYEALAPWLKGQRVALSRDQVLEAFAAAEPEAEAQAPAALYPEILARVHRRLAANWGAEPSAEEAARFAASVGDWPPFADTPAALGYLKQHFKLVILSNVDRASFARSQTRLGVEFDAVFTAEDIGSYKPDLRNFRYLLDQLATMGVDASRLLHVAQSLYHDHVPARQLGLATCWIDRRQGGSGSGATKSPGEAVTPDFQAHSLADLVEQHKALRG